MRIGLVLALLGLAAGCLQPASPAPASPAPDGVVVGPLAIASAAFADGGSIPRKHACDGEGVSPPLDIRGGPDGTVAYALVVLDPDVPIPQAPTRTITHWLVWDFVDGSFPEGDVPEGAIQGGDGREGWGPPCPPVGSPPHRYVFTAYALDAPLGLAKGSTRAQVEARLNETTLEAATLTGTYSRGVV